MSNKSTHCLRRCYVQFVGRLLTSISFFVILSACGGLNSQPCIVKMNDDGWPVGKWKTPGGNIMTLKEDGSGNYGPSLFQVGSPKSSFPAIR